MGEGKNNYQEIPIVSDPTRYYISDKTSHVVDIVVEKTNVMRAQDPVYGTTFPFINSYIDIFGELKRSYQYLNRKYRFKEDDLVSRSLDRTDLNSYLFTLRMRQSQFEKRREIQIQSFYEFLSLLGAFWGVCFNIGTWTLRPYIRF